MAKETCARCHGPREPESTSYSYCISCGREIQRDRYRQTREKAGYTVRPRIDANSPSANIDRRAYLRNSNNLPGACECCGGPSPNLILEHYSTSNPPDPNDLVGTPFALWCFDCHKVAQSLTSAELRRIVQVFQYLARADIEHGAVLKDSIWPVQPPTANTA